MKALIARLLCKVGAHNWHVLLHIDGFVETRPLTPREVRTGSYGTHLPLFCVRGYGCRARVVPEEVPDGDTASV